MKSLAGRQTEKSAGKKATDTTNNRNKAEQNEKTRTNWFKIDWFERLEHIILEYYTGF